MKFYIASRLENAAEVSRVAEALKAAGHEHTYDWTVHGDVTGASTIEKAAWCELDGIRRADVVIGLLPGKTGTYFELGFARSENKLIYLCGRDVETLASDAWTVAACGDVYWATGTTDALAEWLLEALV